MRVITLFSSSHCWLSSPCLDFNSSSSLSSLSRRSLEALSVSFANDSFCISSFSTARSTSSSAVGFDVISIFSFAAASSTKSMAAHTHPWTNRTRKATVNSHESTLASLSDFVQREHT